MEKCRCVTYLAVKPESFRRYKGINFNGELEVEDQPAFQSKFSKDLNLLIFETKSDPYYQEFDTKAIELISGKEFILKTDQHGTVYDLSLSLPDGTFAMGKGIRFSELVIKGERAFAFFQHLNQNEKDKIAYLREIKNMYLTASERKALVDEACYGPSRDTVAQMRREFKRE